MIWTDIHDIAISLSEIYEDVDPRYILFTDLMQKVLELEDFDDDPSRVNEQILEAIQAAWIEELD
ncbi:MAG: Fe-S cluster assembly protein IscX [SAR86 cluster bacterium]|jgi:FeS assembly protein IscX|nr:Fe-S cluster assembly protein IscX [SAR86 cluster bacterium]|tara:strand:+ start:3612 stop:3806 length:195 start_codon:yes stop_codon:yes gene_type:complete